MKKNVLTTITLATLFAIASVTSLSAKGYGMAGCGLGSIVIGPDGGITQIFAATTNGTSYSQTLGITSGTSNCVENNAAYIKQQQKIFVSVNYKGLEQEMAAGKGQKIDALANLLGCPADKLAVESQKNHGKLFNSVSKENPIQLISNVKANLTMANSCKNI